MRTRRALKNAGGGSGGTAPCEPLFLRKSLQTKLNQAKICCHERSLRHRRKKDCFCPSGTTFSIQGLPADRPLPTAPPPSCLRYSSPYIIPALASFRPLRPLAWALPPAPTAQHNSNLLSKAPLDRRACEAGAGVVRLEKNKSFLFPTRKRRFFARSGLKSVSSKKSPLTPSAQKRLFLPKRYGILHSGASRRPAPADGPAPFLLALFLPLRP